MSVTSRNISELCDLISAKEKTVKDGRENDEREYKKRVKVMKEIRYSGSREIKRIYFIVVKVSLAVSVSRRQRNRSSYLMIRKHLSGIIYFSA